MDSSTILPPIRWRKSLHFKFLIAQLVLLLFVIGGTVAVIFVVERAVLVKQSHDLAEQVGHSVVYNLESRLAQAETLTISLAEIGGSLEKNADLFHEIIPRLLDFEPINPLVAGGGIWPEPFAFDPQVKRRSFFWGRNTEGKLKYFDEYNNPDGPGYHNEEWYVPALRHRPHEVFWSKSYVDPYSMEPMVTCSAPMFNNGTVSGVATVDLKLGGIKEFLDITAQTVGGYIFAVDRNNKFIAFPNESLAKINPSSRQSSDPPEFMNVDELGNNEPLFKPLSDALTAINIDIVGKARTDPRFTEQLVSNIAQDSYQINALESQVIGATIVDPFKGQRDIEFSRLFLEDDVILNSPVMVSIFHVKKAYWKVVVVTPTSKFNAAADTVTQKVALYIVAIELLGLIVLFWILRRFFIKPISSMAAELIKSEQHGGVRENPLNESAQHELGFLAKAFNQRTNNLIYAKNELAWVVSEQAKIEEVLQEREENLRITLDSIGEAVIAFDKESRIVWINLAASTMLTISPDDVGGMLAHNCYTLFDPETKKATTNPVESVLNPGGTQSESYRSILKTHLGEEKLVSYLASPILDINEKTVGVVLVIKDISEQNQIEEQFIEAQKMESIGQIAGGIAHDFNNMLGGIIGSLEMIELKFSHQKDLKKRLGTAMNATKKAADLTRNLLAFSRKAVVESVPIEIHKTIQQSIELLTHVTDRNILVRTKFEASDSVVIGDRVQLQNVVLNLGINARDAMQNGGKLLFSTSNIFLDKAYCAESRHQILPGGFLVISVSDTGSGMEDEVRKRIFEPFFTTKEIGKGTGLGLAAVGGTISHHRGFVEVESILGQGSVFKIYLPVQETPEPIEGNPQFKPYKIGSSRLLIVDDEPLIRESMKDLLSHMGYNVLTAADGEEALRIYKTEGASIDLIVLDMVMPNMGGKETFEALFKMDPEVKIILASGYSKHIAVNKMLREKSCGFVQKPFMVADLNKLIEKILNPQLASSAK